jgi:hypothetical protein
MEMSGQLIYKTLFKQIIISKCRDCATGWTTGVQFLAGEVIEFFSFATASRPTQGPTQPPIQWVPLAVSPQVKRPGREADHSPPSCAAVKSACQYLHSPIRLRGVVPS